IVQLIEAAETITAFNGHVPAEIPPRRERKLTLRLDAAAPAIEAPVLRLCAWEISVVLIDGGELDRVGPRDIAKGYAMPPITLPQDALLGRIHWVERKVIVRCQREVVGHLDTKPQIL